MPHTPGHFRARLTCGRCVVLCVLLAIGELCGVIRRAVGGSPRVSGFFACVCVSLTGAIHAAARTHTPGHFRARLACGRCVVCVCVVGDWRSVWCDQASRGRQPTGVGFLCVCLCFVDWRHPCRRTHAHTRALPCPARLARGGDVFDVNAGPDVRSWYFLSPAAGHPRLRCA